ncbi:MAG TPA: 4a-hydroxytetrahydrobiopterin dehydratase [Ilumatobacteraceae bacterium]|nr:4a-hydroxytetrahydrobiopterin dehydratase [Ilumatobacteraceae bacterium]
MSDAPLTDDDIAAANLADWRAISSALQTRFRTGDFATGLRLVNLIGEAAEQVNHHPDLDLRYPHLNVRLYSHDVSGITQRDVALARRISELAAGLGVVAEPSLVSVLELALDTPDHQRIKPFWRTVLGYRDNPNSDDEVRNDDGDLPTIWFQRSGVEEPRQRFHIDIRVPPEVAQQRIDAAVAAGGKVVDQSRTFVVLADPDGNKVCVCT